MGLKKQLNISKTINYISARSGGVNFGTDGWRGIIADDFTYENLGKLAYGVAQYAGGRGEKICIGYDNRFMSDDYASFFAAILEDEGITVDLSDKSVPTPCVSHRVKRTGALLGICISASHNPAIYNGIKIKENYGGSASSRLVSDIVKNMRNVRSVKKNDKGLSFFSGANRCRKALKYNGTIIKQNPQGRRSRCNAGWGLKFNGTRNNWQSLYLKEFTGILPAATASRQRGGRSLKVVCDYFHGSGYPYFEKVLKEKGYTAVSLRCERDPLFGGINPEPKPENLVKLADTVLKEKADIGFAFDGDADRIAVIDEKGEYLSLQRILGLLAYDMLKNGKSGRKGTIIKTVAGTYLVDRLCQRYGVLNKTVKIGFKNICPEMLNGDVLIAGEESGGIGFGDYLPERDAIYTAVRILEMVIRNGKFLSQLWDEMKKEFGDSVYKRSDLALDTNSLGGGHCVALKKTTRDCRFLAEQIAFNLADKVNKNLAAVQMPFKVENISLMDGVRINMAGGRWLLLRLSGTEPLIRIYAETESRRLTEELIEKGKEIIL